MVIKNIIKGMVIGLTMLLGSVNNTDAMGGARGPSSRGTFSKGYRRASSLTFNKGIPVSRHSRKFGMYTPSRLPKKSNVASKPVRPSTPTKQNISTKQNKSEIPQAVALQNQTLPQEPVVKQLSAPTKPMPETQNQSVSRTNSSTAHKPAPQETVLSETSLKVPVVENPFKGIKPVAPVGSKLTYAGGVKTDVHSMAKESGKTLSKMSEEKNKVDVYTPEKRPSLMERVLKEQGNYYLVDKELATRNLPIDDEDLHTSYSTDKSANTSNEIEKNGNNTERKTDTGSLNTKIVTEQNKKHETIKVESQDWGPYINNKISSVAGWMWNVPKNALNYVKTLSLSDAIKPFDMFMVEVERQDPKTNKFVKTKVSIIEAAFIKGGLTKEHAWWATKIATTLLVLYLYSRPGLQKSDSAMEQIIMQTIVPATIEIGLGGASPAEVLAKHSIAAGVGNYWTGIPGNVQDKIALVKLLNNTVGQIPALGGFLWRTLKAGGSLIVSPFKWMLGIGSTANASAPIQNSQSAVQSAQNSTTPTEISTNTQQQPQQLVPAAQPTNTQLPPVTPPQLPVQSTNQIAQPAAPASPGWIPWLYNWGTWIMTFKAACTAIFPPIWAQVKDLPETVDSNGSAIQVNGKSVDKSAVEKVVHEGCINKFGPNVSDETKQAFLEEFLKQYANEIGQGAIS